MKPLTINNVQKLVKDAAGTFNEKTLATTKAILSEVIDGDMLVDINDSLARQNRRQITLDDVARVAYVHGRSILENDGYSPYTRVMSFNAKNGFNYDKFHVKLITQMLLDVEYMVQIAEENRKAKKCRQYRMADDVKARLGIK